MIFKNIYQKAKNWFLVVLASCGPLSEHSKELNPSLVVNTPPIEAPVSKASGSANDNRIQSCGSIVEQFKNPRKSLLRSFKERFQLKKDLRGASKSGAFPSLVLNNDTNKVVFLKIFPKLEDNLSISALGKIQVFWRSFKAAVWLH
jgi:hypothetical protein